MGQHQREQLEKIAMARKNSIKRMVAIAVVAVLAFVAFQVLRPEHRDIRTVRNTVHRDSGMTYGAILEGYATRTNWSRHTSVQFMRVVEFNGTARNGDRILIQFTDFYELHNGEWIIANMEINGRQMGSIESHAWLTSAANTVRR